MEQTQTITEQNSTSTLEAKAQSAGCIHCWPRYY